MINYGIDLNLIPGGVAPRVDVSQYDHGQTITCVLWDGNTAFSLPNGSAASVTGTKPDGTGFIYACTYYQGSPVVTITEQMTAVAGEVACELVIVGDGDRQGTVNFVLDVEPAAMRSDVPISETDIPIIQQLPEIVAEVEGYAEEAHQWATYGSEGETPSATNNAKYWAGIAQTYATGALHWMGSVAFEDIPTTGLANGDFYNITNDFTTDNRFIEGAGKECAAGTNIVYTGSLWDIVTPATTASQVKFDNTGTGMSATNTQDAIEEVNSNLVKIKHTTETVTTNANAVAALALSKPIIHITPIIGGHYAAVLGAYESGQAQTIKLFTTNTWAPAASQQVTLDIYYLDV